MIVVSTHTNIEIIIGLYNSLMIYKNTETQSIHFIEVG